MEENFGLWLKTYSKELCPCLTRLRALVCIIALSVPCLELSFIDLFLSSIGKIADSSKGAVKGSRGERGGAKASRKSSDGRSKPGKSSRGTFQKGPTLDCSETISPELLGRGWPGCLYGSLVGNPYCQGGSIPGAVASALAWIFWGHQSVGDMKRCGWNPYAQ